MEQSFLLKRYGDYSIFEQGYMSAEERAWNIRRIEEEENKNNESGKKPPPTTPRIPKR